MNAKYKQKDILTAIMLFFILRPSILMVIPHMYTVFNVVLLGGLIMMFFRNHKHVKHNKLFLSFTVLESFILLITIINSGYYQGAVNKMTETLLLICLICSYENDMFRFIKITYHELEILIYLNLITLILVPEGLVHIQIDDYWYGTANQWVIGVPNTFIYWLFPMAVISILLTYLDYKNKVRYFASMLAVIGTEIINGSGTGKIMIILYIAIIFLPLIKRFISTRSILIASAFAFITIVITRSYEILAPIIQNFLHKEMTLTNRVYIWDNVLREIAEKPIIGNGLLTGDDMIQRIGMFLGVLHGGSTHAHCHYLQILFEGGFIGFALFVNIYILLIKRTSKIRDSKAVRAVVVGLLVFSIGAVVEVFDYATMYLVFMLVYFAPEISRIEQTVTAVQFAVPTGHKNRTMPYKER
jgi:O-antigen ligase